MDPRLPAPVITIIDPTRPGEVGDVLVSGQEREQWRPSRRHWTALVLVLALAGAVVGPSRVVSARADQQRKALAEAELLPLSVAADTDEQGAVTLEVTNDSDARVELLDLAVQAPGYATLRLRRHVGAHQQTRVRVPDTRTCGRDLVRPTLLGEAVVHVRTSAGRTVTRRIDLLDQAWHDLQAAARARCGWLLPVEAVQVTASWHPVDADLYLVLKGRNAGRSAVRLGPISDDTSQVLLDPGTEPVLIAPGAAVDLRFRAVGQDCSASRQEALASLSLNLTSPDDTSGNASLAVLTDDSSQLDAWLARRCG